MTTVKLDEKELQSRRAFFEITDADLARLAGLRAYAEQHGDSIVDGLYEPTGDGDVHVWPCLSSTGAAVVIIELCSPDGELLVQANSRKVTGFVTSMLDSVPDGQESSFVDFDLELATLLGE